MKHNKIFFHDIGVSASLLRRKDLKDFLLTLFNKEGARLKRVDIIFCTDENLLSLNAEFLNHHYYTDTMSFILSNPEEPIIGEIYISIDRIRSNAKHYKKLYQNELCRVILHGCLHLCGYTDKPKKAADKMEALQEKYLKLFDVSRETQIGG